MYLTIILYISLIIIFVYWSYVLYVNIKHPFWSKQPVFHFHNLNWYFRFPLIINKPPISNSTPKFYDKYNNHTFQLNDTNSENFIPLLRDFISENYLRNEYAIYNPSKKEIASVFKYHDSPCHISYHAFVIYPTPIVNSIITTRPVNIQLYNTDTKSFIFNKTKCGYVDFLCTKKSYRKKHITESLIYTHYINISHIYNFFIFKREGHLAPFVPAVKYNAYCFDTTNWIHRNGLENKNDVTINIIDDSMVDLLLKALTNIQSDKNIELCVLPDYSNIVEQVKSKLLIPIIITNNKTPHTPFAGLYFLRNCSVKYKNKHMMEMINVYCPLINNKTDIQINWWLKNIIQSVSVILNKMDITYLLIENICHGNVLLDNICKRYKEEFVSPMAYYYYNFGFKPIQKDKAFIYI